MSTAIPTDKELKISSSLWKICSLLVCPTLEGMALEDLSPLLLGEGGDGIFGIRERLAFIHYATIENKNYNISD